LPDPSDLQGKVPDYPLNDIQFNSHGEKRH
jgi:hypothetical protein